MILKTTDGGATWNTVVSGNAEGLRSICFPNSNTGYSAGENGTILKTTNGGTTWTTVSSGTSEEFFTVFFPDPNVGYTAGDFGTILKTIDGGTSWTVVSYRETEQATSIYFPAADRGYAVGSGYVPHFTVLEPYYTAGIILKTIDGGDTWTVLSSETCNNLSAVYFTDNWVGYAVGTGGTILKTSDGGVVSVPENRSRMSAFTIYPNPANNKITITNNIESSEETSVTIFNINGEKLVQSKFRNQNDIEINVSTLAKGIYIIRIQSGSGIESKKLVIQ